MNINVVKGILLAVMALVTFLFGILPLKVLKMLAQRDHDASKKKSKMPALLLSLLSCCAGGVFFGVCFLELFPEANDSFRRLKQYQKWTTMYPFVELLTGVGFVLVYLIEELAIRLFPEQLHVHRHETEADVHIRHRIDSGIKSDSDITNNIAEPEVCMDDDGSSAIIRRLRQPHAHSHAVRSFTFILALSFHALLEGVAFGFQSTEPDATALFFGLIVHKSIVAFSVGMQAARTHPNRVKLVVALVAVFVCMSPIGGAVGIIIEVIAVPWLFRHLHSMLFQTFGTNLVAKEIATTVLMSLSIGTFIYITFFEILLTERDNEHSNLLKLLALAVGYAMISVLMIADPGHRNTKPVLAINCCPATTIASTSTL